MAAPYIDASFKEKFNQDLHLEFTQRQSLFRGTVRTDGQVDGSQVHFEKLGTLIMQDKARGGDVPVTNPAHNRVTATMVNKYLRNQLDVLDLSKVSTNIKAGKVQQMTFAANKYIDELLISKMDAGATGSIGDYGSSDTKYIDENMALEIGEYFDRRDVPRDGNLFCAVTPRQWAALMKITSFSSSDYVGADLPFKKMGNNMRTWNDIHWFRSNYLTGVGTATAKCFAYHSSAVGFGINKDYESIWSYNGGAVAWDCVGYLSCGAVVIDTDGIVEVRVDDTGALPT